MKKILPFLFMLIFLSVHAGDYDAKLKWETSYDEAIKLAEKDSKSILVFFHGSDWCPPCIKMQKEVFADEKFITFSKDKLVFLDIDFPHRKKLSEQQMAHNKEIKKRFGLPEEYQEGYPQVALINSTGKILYQEKGYAGGGPDYLIKKIEEALRIPAP